MNEIEKKRLSILKKQNYLNRILPKYLVGLIGIEPKLESATILQIEEVEVLISRLRRNNRETVLIKRATKSNPEKIARVLEKLTDKLNHQNYFSINNLQEVWFAEVNTKFVIGNFEKIIDIDGDTVIVHDREAKNGLWIDLNEEYWTTENQVNYEWVYEIKVWGEDWTDRIF